MNRPEKTPGRRGAQPNERINNQGAEQTSGREGGDDAIANSSPSDSRLDEQVVVNTQRENRAVNAPSQTGAHPSELESSGDEDIF